MKNTKKHLEITGSLIHPIEIGLSALIQEGLETRKTSTVLSIEKISSTEVQFETKNTNYLLHLFPLSIKESDKDCIGTYQSEKNNIN